MKECEGCGLISGIAKYVGVNLTNGHLWLCQQCLEDFNRKNPQITILQAEIEKLRAALDGLMKAPGCCYRCYNVDEKFQRECQEDCDCHCHPAAAKAREALNT